MDDLEILLASFHPGRDTPVAELIPCNWESDAGDLCNRISGCLKPDCPLAVVLPHDN